MSACTCGHLATSHNATAYTASECAEQCHCEAYRDAEAEQLRARIVRLLSIIAELDAEIAQLRESFADQLQAMVVSDRAETKWTTTPPTVPGYYWATDKRFTSARVEIVEIAENGHRGLTASSIGCEMDSRLDYFTHWLGPIDIPEPPR